MSYFGWNSRDDSYAAGRSLDASIALRQAGSNEDLIIRLNDSGCTFDEIAANFSTPVLDQICYIDEIYYKIGERLYVQNAD
jgi:hypothetical protein